MALKLYYGLQGCGKSLNMVADTVALYRQAPSQIYSNMAELQAPEAIYFDSVDEIVHVSDGIINLDETGIVIPAQFWHEAGRDLLVSFCQFRKRRLDLIYTCQRLNGTNVNLREQTTEVYHCSKMGPVFFMRRELPDKKARGGVRKRLFNRAIANLYNSYETIMADGGSGGEVTRTPLSLAVRRSRERRQRRVRVPAPECLLYEKWWSGWWGANSVLALREDASQALSWLKDGDYIQEGEHWADAVRAELARRAWLKIWGLGPDEVPITCTRQTPWLPGYDPETVKRRRRELEKEVEIARLAIRTTVGKLSDKELDKRAKEAAREKVKFAI